MRQIVELNPTAIVLSPGPGIPQEAGLTMEIIASFMSKIPILGICLGHQALGLSFGFKLQRALLPMHGKVDLLTHQNHWIFENISPSFEVMRYHSLILNENDSAHLDVIATNEKGEIMAIAHKNLPIVGLQFHPESILTPFGNTMVFNFIKFALKK